MRTFRALGFALMFAGAAFVAAAQDDDGKSKPDKAKPEPAVKVGDKAPIVKIDSVLSGKLKTMGELRGRLVLYDYFQHW